MSDTAQQYINGAFTVTQSTVTDPDGRTWLQLELCVSSDAVRVPVKDGQLRQAELKAERLCLAAIAAELETAAQPEDNQ